MNLELLSVCHTQNTLLLAGCCHPSKVGRSVGQSVGLLIVLIFSSQYHSSTAEAVEYYKSTISIKAVG